MKHHGPVFPPTIELTVISSLLYNFKSIKLELNVFPINQRLKWGLRLRLPELVLSRNLFNVQMSIHYTILSHSPHKPETASIVCRLWRLNNNHTILNPAFVTASVSDLLANPFTIHPQTLISKHIISDKSVSFEKSVSFSDDIQGLPKAHSPQNPGKSMSLKITAV